MAVGGGEERSPPGLPVTASAQGASGVLLVFLPSQLVFTGPLLTF